MFRFSTLIPVAMILSSVSIAQAAPNFQATFAEDNDLWMEDNLMAESNVTKEMFQKIIDAGMAAYKPFADQNKETIQINARWDDATVNANCGRNWGSVTVNMYGGLARRPEVTPDAFALVLCHELGHAYGGTPYIQAFNKMAAEGQADFYGAGTCLESVLKQIPVVPEMVKPTAYMQKRCAELNGDNAEGNEMCLRHLVAGQGLGELLASMKKEAAPNYETPDPTVVKKTQLSYPATTQCRLDTYLAGALDLSRPVCWFKD